MNLGSSIRLNKGGVVGLFLIGVFIFVIYRSTGPASVLLPSEMRDGTSSDTDIISLKELLSAAIDAAGRGGNEVRRVREEATLQQKSKGETKEGVNDPVTNGDLLSHNVMYYSLHKSFPTLEIISEEHDTLKDTSYIAPANIRDLEVEKLMIIDKIVFVKDVRVWIDPLDATKEYTENLIQYVTTMVGIAVQGIPTIGVVHRPFSNVTHWGWLDNAVSPDLQVIKQSGLSLLPSPTVSPRLIVSISHQGTVKDVATHAFGPDTTIIAAAGAGYKIMEVITGAADAYVHTTAIKKWDLCAGHAILSAMGGTLTTLRNDAAASIEITYEDRNKYKNEAGLLATMKNHEFYLDRLQALKN